MRGRKMKRKFAMIVLGVSFLLQRIPTYAEQAINISLWALPDVCEGEKYGIYPFKWYETSTKLPIDQSKLNHLYEAIGKKFEKAQLVATSKAKITEGTTREDVIRGLYNQLAQYGDALEKLNPNNLDAIEYFKEKGYVKGTTQGLALEKPCTVEQAIILATHLIKGTYESLDQGAKGLGYKITNADNTVYVLGSLHVGNSDMYPIDASLTEAFNESEGLFVEANILNPQEGIEEYLEKAKYNDGSNLEQHISNETYEKTVKALEKYSLPVEAYKQFRPWCIAGDLTSYTAVDEQKNQELGTAAVLGVDRYFLEKALFSGKQVTELEGLSYQANLFNGLSDEVQEEYLLSTVELALQPEKISQDAPNSIMEIQQYWCEGDYDKFVSEYDMSLKNTNNEFTTMLLGKRDEDMAEKISKLLDMEGSHTYFIVIGAAHVVMPDMTVDKLKQKGYTVEQFQ